tara:strand:- start:25838 stop:26383 length:546 start_codon:yes stop_codon:yes gene_type:complete
MSYTKRTRRRANQVWNWIRRNPGCTRYDIMDGLKVETAWMKNVDQTRPALDCLMSQNRLILDRKGPQGRFRYWINGVKGSQPTPREAERNQQKYSYVPSAVVDEIAVPMNETLSTTDDEWDIFAKINKNNDLVIRVKGKDAGSHMTPQYQQLFKEYMGLVDTITAFYKGEITINQLKEAIE